MFDRIREMKEQKRKAEEAAEQERRIKERALINKTLRNLKSTMEKYERQKKVFIDLARQAEACGMTAQYHLAANGLKIVMESYDRASQMYMNLTISNQINETFSDTKAFVDSMSTISRQLSELQSNIDIESAQTEYAVAMSNIAQSEAKLREFSESVCDSANNLTEGFGGAEKVDDAIAALIHSNGGAISIPSVPAEDNSAIDRKLRELEGRLNAGR